MDDRYQSATLTKELPFGKYFEAEDSFIQRKVQLFRFSTPGAAAPSNWKDIFGECSAALGTISHPGLPIIYEHGIDEEGPFSIRQMLDTTSLNQRLVEGGKLSEYEGWELAQQLLEIHDAARTSGNFHGALDPNHIGFITRPSGEKRYSITDYGLAQIHKQIHADDSYYGINFLISPEQSKGEEISEKSQLYSIGQLIFHALCGGHPWTDVPVEAIPEQEKLDPISAYNETIPEAMDVWLSKLIATDPNERFASYAEAFEQMPAPIQSAPVPIKATAAIFTTPATSTQAVQATPTQLTHSVAVPVSKPPHKNPVILGATAAFLLLIIGMIALSGGDDDEPNSSETSSENVDPLTVGRVAFFDFDSRNISSSGEKPLQLVPLKRKADFSNTGFKPTSKRSLVLDKNHFFKLAIKDTAIGIDDSLFTVSFWIQPSTSADSMLSLRSKQPWNDSNSLPVGDNFNKDLNNTVIYGNTWNMVTMVFDKSNNNVLVYVDGQLISDSKTDEISNSSSDGFIYIGCDSKGNSIHITPVLIDDLAIWDRALGDEEIIDLYNQ